MSNNIKKAAVIGLPVTQSLSPAMHGFWLEKYAIKGLYEARAIIPEHLETFMELLRQGAYVGVNVTIPYKEKIIPYLDVCDDTAKTVGAVNAVTVKNGKLFGSNTDISGFLEHLRNSTSAYQKHHAIVLGAGGAARAACRALEMDGFKRITICARSAEKANAIQKISPDKITLGLWEEKHVLLKSCDVLVNATSLGMKGKEALDINLENLSPHAVVYDVVYNPLMTNLLAQAQSRGNKIIDGLGMLIYQAVPCFDAWFGVRPEVGADIRSFLSEQLV